MPVPRVTDSSDNVQTARIPGNWWITFLRRRLFCDTENFRFILNMKFLFLLENIPRCNDYFLLANVSINMRKLNLQKVDRHKPSAKDRLLKVTVLLICWCKEQGSNYRGDGEYPRHYKVSSLALVTATLSQPGMVLSLALTPWVDNERSGLSNLDGTFCLTISTNNY